MVQPDVVVDRIVRQQMSYEEFLALPEGVRAEYVRGELLLVLDATTPRGEVGVGEHGVVPLDLQVVLG